MQTSVSRVHVTSGPLLDVKVCLHQERYGFEIHVESLYRDRKASWVLIVNGIKLSPKRQKPFLLETLSRMKMDRHQYRKIQSRLSGSVKSMIRLLRNDSSIPREDDGTLCSSLAVPAKRAASVPSSPRPPPPPPLPRGVSDSTNLLLPPSIPRVFCERHDADTCVFWTMQEMLQLADFHLGTFTSFNVLLHCVENHHRLLSSNGGFLLVGLAMSVGCAKVCLQVEAALCFPYILPRLYWAKLCGVCLLVIVSRTALTGGVSTFILIFLFCVLSERVPQVLQVLRFSEQERICDTDRLK